MVTHTDDFLTKLIGFKSDRLTVIEMSHIKNRRTYWKCICSCGNYITSIGKNIKNGNTTSCGCKRKETLRKLRMLPYGESSFNQVYKSYINGASSRGLEFNISKDVFRKITKEECFYCGVLPRQMSKVHNYFRTGAYIYNGIDRYDNNKGYVEDNIVPCCKNCNTMKMSLDVNTFLDIISRIYERHIDNAKK